MAAIENNRLFSAIVQTFEWLLYLFISSRYSIYNQNEYQILKMEMNDIKEVDLVDFKMKSIFLWNTNFNMP